MLLSLLSKQRQKTLFSGSTRLASAILNMQAQEIIDAFCVKFDEHVVLNRYNIPYGHTTYGFGAVTGRGGPFPTGDSMNQWIQQVIVLYHKDHE